MKTKAISADKTTLLVVEFPNTHYFLHDKNWELIGRLPDITEEQAEDIVDSEDFKHYSGEYFHMFVDYNNCENAFDDALDSLHSLLQANDIYFENSIKHPRQMNMQPASVGWYNRQVQAYEEAQSKVWNKERTYLFIKVD